MALKNRIYDAILRDHLARYRQMVFVSGARQVGKTTMCRRHADTYLNWDDVEDRDRILAGPSSVAGKAELQRLRKRQPVMLLDELHKYRRWKQFLKGFFDVYGEDARILVTGSSRVDLYRRGSDSLMGRYFHYRMHPFSVAELVSTELPDTRRIVRKQSRIASSAFGALLTHGGFPEPFLRRDRRFSRRWQALRFKQLVREDIRDFTQIQGIDQLESLVRLLAARSAHQLIYQRLARTVRVSVDTIRRWIRALCDLHLGFVVKPWSRNVARSLRKEPKWLLRDWSAVSDRGNRAETFIGCHLLKATEGWTDMGLGEFDLHYLRDKEQREVDFLVVRDGCPWFLVEAKYGRDRIGKALAYYQNRLKVPYAFQVVLTDEYVDADCFARRGRPVCVPARTFLSQLL